MSKNLNSAIGLACISAGTVGAMITMGFWGNDAVNDVHDNMLDREGINDEKLVNLTTGVVSVALSLGSTILYTGVLASTLAIAKCLYAKACDNKENYNVDIQYQETTQVQSQTVKQPLIPSRP